MMLQVIPGKMKRSGVIDLGKNFLVSVLLESLMAWK